MEEQTQEMILVGYHHFYSKDKTKEFLVVQCLFNEDNRERNNFRGTMIKLIKKLLLWKLVLF